MNKENNLTTNMNKIFFRMLGVVQVQIGCDINFYELDDWVGIFKGEILNVDDLANKFSLNKKTYFNMEIILPLFKEVGKSIIQYLDGCYAGVIYNKITQEFFFLRDYVGGRSLFVVKTQGSIHIVDQLKRVDIDSFQMMPKGFSQLIDERIHLVEAHQIDIISKNEVRETIVGAIKKCIPKNDNILGVFLSGGLDSSIIASVVAQQNENVTYYTLGKTADLCYVKSIANRLGIDNKIKYVALPKKSELPRLIEKIVYYTESYNPSIISNGLATYLLCKAAHDDGINIVLTGEGADELFCGYPVSKDIQVWFDKRLELIENMHFTESRRLEMISMAQNVMILCPFLDKDVYRISNDCSLPDLIKDGYGKQILRKTFEHDLPEDILKREKMSFDVGSGIRKMVVEYLTQKGEAEKDVLRKIWSQFFKETLSDHYYFHSYPTFDDAISKRGSVHKK